MGGDKRRVLVVGGQFSGIFTAKDLKKHFHVTVVDAKEFFEYTPGILRCYVKPAHFDSLSFTLQPILERSMGVKYIWGEVKELDGENKCAKVLPIYTNSFADAPRIDTIYYDYCVLCNGCNFNPFSPIGESLWFPTVFEESRKQSEWGHIDERFIEGRRRHILEEYHKIAGLAKKNASIMIAGAGFIGVEWATELEYFFPSLKVTIIDFLPRCLGPLPDGAAEYCSEYMAAVGIKEFYGLKYEPKNPDFWKTVELPDGADYTYVCMGVKASNFFMPKETLSDKGPGGGGWIHFNKYLQVTKKPQPGQLEGDVWGKGCVFAVGDCNYGCIGNPPDWEPKEGEKKAAGMPPIPKISYPGEEQALHACLNIELMDKQGYGRVEGLTPVLKETWWPWGAGMFATSLGPHDACFVLGANHRKHSGYMVNWWLPAALQKEIIETSKVNECKNGIIGTCIWHFVHHTPINFWGAGKGRGSWKW
jgi:NADH dehydrogenase FAD-containing subunit